MSEDGNFFIVGNFFQATDSEFVNLSERQLDGVRKETLAKVPESELLTYGPKDKKDVRGVLYVFTDVNCPYCQQFHNQTVLPLAEKGVEFHYLAYPVIGKERSRTQMISAWCADNPEQRFTDLKNRKDIPEKTCDSQPVDRHLALGESMQVNATPTVFMASGQQINLNELNQVIEKEFAVKLGQ